MDAMEYEYLLRRVYHSARNYNNGADADIYRTMERAHRNLETRSLYATQEEREYEFRTKFSKVRRHVDDAIREGTKQVKHIASEKELKELETMNGKLDWDFYDKEQLDEIIDKAEEIFRKHSLEAK